ncbi:MAG: DJ-1 family protein [Planctomycetes bacterium]|jgi:4-methyl-5(b-hydroxyethyl)-thiazole monophosphate biosynthesis|nr:DJ-1 family protein [Planctomycetota bacterium]
MAVQILVAIADGIEEIEAVTVIDVLRRAGAGVTVASVGALQITASRGVKLIADTQIAQCSDKRYTCIVLPGGMPGAEHLRDSRPLIDLLKAQKERGGWYAAICASPAVVLGTHNLLPPKATCHPAFVDSLPDKSQADQRVVVDGHCVTSRGPGTALEFALELVRQLMGADKAKSVAEPMIALWPQ